MSLTCAEEKAQSESMALGGNVMVDGVLLPIVDGIIERIMLQWPTDRDTETLRSQHIHYCATPAAFSSIFRRFLEEHIRIAINVNGPNCKKLIDCEKHLQSDVRHLYRIFRILF